MKIFISLCVSVILHVAQAQIPELIIQQGKSYTDSVIGFLGGPDVLQFNCDKSTIKLVNQSWPGCPKIAEDYLPDLKEYYDLDLSETYHLVYDFKGQVSIPEMVELVLDRKGKMLTHNQYLQDCFIKNYNQIRYTADGARELALKLGLEEGLRKWEMELRCERLRSSKNVQHPIDAQLYWSIQNVTDLGDGCNITGHFIYIDASNGNLIKDGPYHVKCVE